VRRALLLLTVLLLSSVPISEQSENEAEQSGTEWLRFDLPDDAMSSLVGILDETLSLEDRALLAHSRIGIHDTNGVLFETAIPDELLVPRTDMALLLISPDVRISDARAELDAIPGLSVREFIAPSGLMVQGTQNALALVFSIEGVASTQPIPIAMLVDERVMNSDEGTPVRIESWRGETLLDGVSLTDSWGNSLYQSMDRLAHSTLEDAHFAETGRYDGFTTTSIASLAMEPAIAWVGPLPEIMLYNDQARSHTSINVMRQYYTTDLDGSGIIVAVADSGLDEDHGDFGTRVVGNVDLVGDGSTADQHSGHGTHVACTVLGEGSHTSSYAGIAPEAELYFQAMENDNSGNFQWSSINNMLNTAYNQGARVHTNSWGSSSSSEWGEYTSSAEDVDDRARYYDQYYSGREGFAILFATGNDGPDSGTVGPPATAKNTISVGSSQNRYSGAPNSLMDSSSRGPTDDGRIKPDILAPGGYVRSCRAQEATDTSGSTWSSSWYLEYSGTSMATPNAAGTAALIREYITEIAQRPEPQGALVKALMILGAKDIGSRDIPNMNEGWGRIDLKNSLAPSNDRGIWVDDRSVLSSTGNTKTYSFNITSPNQPFKAVVAWSDERGSRFSNTQLVNDLDLTLTDPSGTEYRGNVFSQGRSIQGGNYDDLNNVEVVLIDNADIGLWSLEVRDAGHSGSKSQPFAVAVSGVGVNDLRPDPSPLAATFSTDIDIPQVGDSVFVEIDITNLGNVEAQGVEVIFQEEGVPIDTTTFDLGPGGVKALGFWWNPQTAGSRTLTFLVDSDDSIDEINEANNRVDIIVNVTTPGVRIESDDSTTVLTDILVTTSSWQVVLTNTALLSTNASLSSNGVTSSNGATLPWYVGLDETDFSLEGQEGALVNVTLVHPAGPEPGIYSIELLGEDTDNNVESPFTLELDVPILADTRIEIDYQKIPVHPSDPTSIDVRLFNDGNTDIGYDLFLESPPGWHSGFDDLSLQGGANSGSTGLMLKDGERSVGITFTPPQVMTLAGSELTVKLRVVSQTETAGHVIYDLPLIVQEIKEISVNLETQLSSIMPGSTISLQYSIEHEGNIDLDLSPRLQLPTGWIQNTILEDFTLSWTDSQNLLISITADEGAKSGDITFIIDGPSLSWQDQSPISVIQLAEPVMTFLSLEIEGEIWSNEFGSGSHPTGKALNYTWLISNEADTLWNPSTTLQMDNGLLGECDNVEPLTKDEVEAMTCTVIIPATANPGSEPSFTVVLDDGSVSIQYQISMSVAEVKEITWKFEGASNVETGVESTIQITITNTGNSLISDRVSTTPPEGWTAAFDGSDMIDLSAGESKRLRLKVNSSQPGEVSFTFALANSPEVSGRTITYEMNSEGEIITEQGTNMTIVTLSIFGVLIIVILAGLLIRRMASETDHTPLVAPAAAPTAAAFSAPVDATPCWSCRQPIISGMLGCPKCGARYHSVCDVKTCLNCESGADSFVIVE